MIRFGLPALIALMGLLYIFIIPEDVHIIKLLFKLIPMWLIILYAYLQLPTPRKYYHWVFIIGLFICMLGDGLLDWFVIGLTAFLIGHLFYMTGFFSRWNFSKLRFIMILPIALYGVFMGWRIIVALIEHHNTTLIVPIILYITVISLMTWSAIMTGNKWAIIGGILFTASDSILSWDLFVSDIAFSGPLIMLTYYTAQFSIAHSIRTIDQDLS